jgi:hypothetical protein
MTIFAGLNWRAQIAPTNFDLLHVIYSHHPRPSRALALGAKTILRDLSAVAGFPCHRDGPCLRTRGIYPRAVTAIARYRHFLVCRLIGWHGALSFAFA